MDYKNTKQILKKRKIYKFQQKDSIWKEKKDMFWRLPAFHKYLLITCHFFKVAEIIKSRSSVYIHNVCKL